MSRKNSQINRSQCYLAKLITLCIRREAFSQVLLITDIYAKRVLTVCFRFTIFNGFNINYRIQFQLLPQPAVAYSISVHRLNSNISLKKTFDSRRYSIEDVQNQTLHYSKGPEHREASENQSSTMSLYKHLKIHFEII